MELAQKKGRSIAFYLYQADRVLLAVRLSPGQLHANNISLHWSGMMYTCLDAALQRLRHSRVRRLNIIRAGRT